MDHTLKSSGPKRRTKTMLINLVSVALVFVILALVKENGLINNYVQGILIQCCYAIIMAVSLNITIGFLGQIALGHAGFMAVGGYTSALVTKALTNAGILTATDEFTKFILFLIGILSGALVAALFGIIVGIPALRLRGDYLAIITLAFGEIIRVVIQNLPFAGGRGLSRGQAGQALIGIKNLNNIYIVPLLAVITITLLFTLVRSKFGRAIMAIREDDIASEVSGLNTTYYKVLAFTVSAFFAGVAGAVFAHRGLGTLQHTDFTFLKSTEYVIMVVIGGMGSITGSIIAAILLSVLPELLRTFAEYRMLVYSLVLILMMVFRPSGICGTYEFSMTRFIESITNWFRKNGGKSGAALKGTGSGTESGKEERK